MVSDGGDDAASSTASARLTFAAQPRIGGADRAGHAPSGLRTSDHPASTSVERSASSSTGDRHQTPEQVRRMERAACAVDRACRRASVQRLRPNGPIGQRATASVSASDRRRSASAEPRASSCHQLPDSSGVAQRARRQVPPPSRTPGDRGAGVHLRPRSDSDPSPSHAGGVPGSRTPTARRGAPGWRTRHGAFRTASPPSRSSLPVACATRRSPSVQLRRRDREGRRRTGHGPRRAWNRSGARNKAAGDAERGGQAVAPWLRCPDGATGPATPSLSLAGWASNVAGRGQRHAVRRPPVTPGAARSHPPLHPRRRRVSRVEALAPRKIGMRKRQHHIRIASRPAPERRFGERMRATRLPPGRAEPSGRAAASRPATGPVTRQLAVNEGWPAKPRSASVARERRRRSPRPVRYPPASRCRWRRPPRSRPGWPSDQTPGPAHRVKGSAGHARACSQPSVRPHARGASSRPLPVNTVRPRAWPSRWQRWHSPGRIASWLPGDRHAGLRRLSRTRRARAAACRPPSSAASADSFDTRGHLRRPPPLQQPRATRRRGPAGWPPSAASSRSGGQPAAAATAPRAGVPPMIEGEVVRQDQAAADAVSLPLGPPGQLRRLLGPATGPWPRAAHRARPRRPPADTWPETGRRLCPDHGARRRPGWPPASPTPSRAGAAEPAA